MKTKPHRHVCAFAFTLIEMLVVIAIIGILAALLFPVIARVKSRAKISQAKTEMATLMLAISQYQMEYSGNFPVPVYVKSVPPSFPDFTFGTTGVQGYGGISIQTGTATEETNNSAIMSILMDREQDFDGKPTVNDRHARNPMRHIFLQDKLVDKAAQSGIGRDLVFRDPWGNPYMITLDVNHDGNCQDGFYYPLTKGANPFLPGVSAMIWSFGPDGKATPDRKVGPKGGVNKDNVVSWER